MEVRSEIFKRVPPGDRWVLIGVEDGPVYESLTAALEYYFQQTGRKQYYIDAGLGMIYSVMEVNDPKQDISPTTYSIYGDSL